MQKLKFQKDVLRVIATIADMRTGVIRIAEEEFVATAGMVDIIIQMIEMDVFILKKSR